ncbi:hypothetical protein Pcinc_023535 [Petrolisthes cinctipes]|uniref:Zinc finger protein 830 n=1 Tax=Petrolisthes cinctipes TaxID=88211 RepID=A0AAE1FDB4_PETCI|nr:hypothetical protein Pcinc_023535 [Petrolisthes cinctipes]
MSGSRDKPQDIKKLMQEQLKTKAVTRQVDSPYAKYNSRGQLMCVVCGTVVKSAIIWQAHVNKRSHQENLTNLKQKQQQLNSHQTNRNSTSSSKQVTTGGAQKRPSSPPPNPPAKKVAVEQVRPKGILKNSATRASTSDDESDEDEVPAQTPIPVTVPQIKVENGESTDSTNGVPEGFFDVEVAAPKPREDESIYKEKPAKPKDPPKPNTTEVLPEGFFDDPVADAKARKVEYKDKKEEEWTSFMKEVSAAEHESQIIIEEDKEKAALTTQIEQANEQIAFLERVVELDREKTTQLKERGSGRTDSGTSEDSSDEEFAPVIWRTKNSLI